MKSWMINVKSVIQVIKIKEMLYVIKIRSCGFRIKINFMSLIKKLLSWNWKINQIKRNLKKILKRKKLEFQSGNKIIKLKNKNDN